MNALKLKALVIERGMTLDTLCKVTGLSKTTMWRKMKNGNFTVKEAQEIVGALGLNCDDAVSIFFSTEVT